jgi:hypothetical protein
MATNDDHSDITDIQLAINEDMYEYISELYQQMIETIPPDQSIGVVVSAVATNLGLIIGQIPEKYRNEYLRVAQTIFEKSFSSTIEKVSYNTYGQVGHG